MKHLKTYLLFLLVFSMCFSCHFSTSQNGEDLHNTKKNITNSNQGERGNIDLKKNFKYHKITDPQNGMVAFQTPLPKNWTYNSDKNAPIVITAPNHIKVNKTETQNYAYANDAFALQSLQQINKPGIEISPIIPINQIIQNYIIPSAKSQGYSFIKGYPLPEVQQFWERYDSGMLKTGSNRTYNVLGTDWKDANGNHSFIVFVQSIIKKDVYITWTLNSTELEAPQSQFKKAKENYIYGMANTQINMSWQQAKNTELLRSIRNNSRFWENATRQSQIAHNQRMAAIESRGNATRSIGKTYSDILDINHAGYLKRNDMNNAGHSKTVNMIGERAIISNMATGERYNVRDGSKFYWVNTSGEYFGTDNAFYDPRIDNRVNHSDWSQFEMEN